MDKDLKELLDVKFEGIADSLHNNREIVNLQLEAIRKQGDTIVEHNERQNGWIKDHTKSIDKLEDHARACKSQRRAIKMIGKKWWLAGLAVVIISIGTTWSYHHLRVDKIKIGPIEMEFEEEAVRGGEVN